MGSAGFVGAVPATTTVNGIGHVSVAPVDAANPIFVGDNDVRVPTADPTTLFAPISTIGLFSGAIQAYAGSSTPSGWLLCDGTSYLRATYPNLFTAIGTTYGSVDGTHFTVPDFRNRSPIGAGTGTVVATFASRSSNVITVTGLTNAANNEFQTGQAVLYLAPSGAMTGLTSNTTYYVIRTGNLTFSLAASLANAQNGTVIALSSDGTGTQTFTLTMTARSLGGHGGEENHAMSLTELLSHTHTVQTPSGGGSLQIASVAASTPSGSTFTPNQVNTAGGNAAMSVLNPFLVINYVIKT